MQSPASERTTARWNRRGLLIAAPSRQSWAHSHAALPTVEARGSGHLDIYYSPRDAQGRAHIARAPLEVTASGELTVGAQHPEPVLAPGPLGAFDEAGVTVSCVAPGRDGTLLYYTGWTLGLGVPFYFYAGVAIRPYGERVFQRISPAPMLERSAVDPYLTASPWVLRDGGVWRMWYVSCVGWEIVAGAPRHYYHLRYAESDDGVHWRREGQVAIDFADDDEYAISRPCVIRDDDGYRMWFAARGANYRLCYAESVDGIHWERNDARAELAAPAEAWDSEMEAYPVVFDCDGTRFLLYNGNGYGRSGIGYATCRLGD